jgi:hypothetical protein
MALKTSPLRSGVKILTGYAERDLDALWRQVATAVQAREALMDVLPSLVATYGDAAGTLAADYYDDLRERKGAKRRFSAIVAELPNGGGTDELARWGVSPLFAGEPDWLSAKALVAGGLQRRIANVSRLTITQSSIQDPGARGWQRVGVGECDFCQMLLGRGAVYTEATADFASHDHCNCAAEPAF